MGLAHRPPASRGFPASSRLARGRPFCVVDTVLGIVGPSASSLALRTDDSNTPPRR